MKNQRLPAALFWSGALLIALVGGFVVAYAAFLTIGPALEPTSLNTWGDAEGLVVPFWIGYALLVVAGLVGARYARSARRTRGIMTTTATIPATLPVEFIERMIHVSGEFDVYRPQLGAVVSLGGRVDEQRLKRALRLLLDAEPILGCRFAAEVVPPVWQRLQGLDALHLLEVRESGDPGADASAFVAEPFDPRVDPQVRAMLLRGPSADLLAVKVQHAAMDGGALKETLYLIGETYRTLGERPDWTPVPNLDGVRRPTARAGVIERMRLLPHSGLSFPPSEWGTAEPGDRGAARYTTASIEPEVFRSAVALGRSVGATVNDIILTAEYRTLYRLLAAAPGSKTPLTISCELRKHLPPGTRTALSNISGAWAISVSPARDETFDGTLARVVEATRAWKHAGAGKAVALAMPFSSALMRKQGLALTRRMMVKMTDGDADPSFAAGLTNIGVIDDAKLDFGAPTQVRDAWLLGPVSPTVLILTASTYRDRLHLALGTEFASMGDWLVSDVLDGAAREIEAWARTLRA
jgi:NRPS condensation-like uncharacterized protein